MDNQLISKWSSEFRFDSNFPKTNCLIITCVWYGRDFGILSHENLDLFFDEYDRLIGWSYWSPD